MNKINFKDCPLEKQKEIKSKIEKYLEKYKTLDNLSGNEDGRKLYYLIYSNKIFVEDVLEDMGLNYTEITNILPIGSRYYYDNFENIRKRLEWFIDKYNHFPTKKQMASTLGISQTQIDKHGGINSLKEKTNYFDKKDLIDNRGDYNKSIMELMLANWFIEMDLGKRYERETKLFKEYNYRDDFTFKTEKFDLFVEVWAYGEGNKNLNSKFCMQYLKSRKIKESLYKKYNMKLISVEPEVYNGSYEEIQKGFYNIFKDYFNLDFKIINYEKLISPVKMTDDEILEEVLKYKEGDRLPATCDIPCSLHMEILKRFKTYRKFSEKYNIKTKRDITDWNIELIFQYFDKLIVMNKTIETKNLLKLKVGLPSAIQKFGSLTHLKLLYFLDNKHKSLPKGEIEWLTKIANGKSINSCKTTDIDKKQAKIILDYRFPNYNNITSCKVCRRNFETTHKYDIYCDNCKKELSNNSISRNVLYSKKYMLKEKDYINNFKDIERYIKQDYKYLTKKQFNKISKIKTKTYVSFYNKTWVEIITLYGYYDKLYDYIKSEFVKYLKETNNYNLHNFGMKHEYITYGLIKEFNKEKIKEEAISIVNRSA